MKEVKAARGAKSDQDLAAADLAEVVRRNEGIVRQRTGHDFPDDPREQLWGRDRRGVPLVGQRAREDVPQAPPHPGRLGHGGQRPGRWCSETAATRPRRASRSQRDPASGEKKFYGEFLPNAQGEDVVAGPSHAAAAEPGRVGSSLEETMPEAYAELLRVRDRLEARFRDMQDLEFTIEENRLYLLQTRNGKRTGFAAVRIATDMVDEGLIDADEAVLRVEPEQLVQLLAPESSPRRRRPPRSRRGGCSARGFPRDRAPPAAASRSPPRRRSRWRRAASPSCWCARRTSPEDIAGMHAAAGILTTRGGANESRCSRRARPWARRASSAPARSRPIRARRGSGARTRREGGRLDLDRRHGRRGHHREAPDPALRGPPGPPSGHDQARAVRRVPRVQPGPRVGRPAPPPRRAAPTPTRRTTRRSPSSSARRGSASAARSTCSSRRSESSP
jgi:hypothetical protein